jgi:hypothetical protein
MSRMLSEAERRVRYHLRDRNPQGEAFTSPEVVNAIEANMRVVSGRLLLGEERVTALVTTANGTQFYTLPGTQTYESLQFLKFQDGGLPVEIASPTLFESYQRTDTSGSQSKGRPQIAMLRESATQVEQIGFWPVPDAAYVLDGYRSLLPLGFFTNGTAALAALPDATVIPFDDQGFDALCYLTAAELFGAMPDPDKERLRLAPNASDSWPGKAAELIADSRRRRIFQKVTTGGNRKGRRW